MLAHLKEQNAGRAGLLISVLVTIQLSSGLISPHSRSSKRQAMCASPCRLLTMISEVSVGTLCTTNPRLLSGSKENRFGSHGYRGRGTWPQCASSCGVLAYLYLIMFYLSLCKLLLQQQSFHLSEVIICFSGHSQLCLSMSVIRTHSRVVSWLLISILSMWRASKGWAPLSSCMTD